jgi:hypothetical protein
MEHPHVQAEQSLLHNEEGYGLSRGEHPDKCGDVAQDVGAEQRPLPRTRRELAAKQVAGAVEVQAQSGEQEQREEEISLISVREAGQSATLGGLGGRKSQGANVDARVFARLVGVSVVSVVVVDPPAVA